MTDARNGVVPSGADDIRLYFEGDALYADMLAAIAAAQCSVCLESYLFGSDEIGWRFARALAGRADAGIPVRLHLDALGAWGRTSERMVRHLEDHGVQLRWFHRWNWQAPLRYNRRNHRKLLVVDRSVAFTGGFNIHRESSAEVYGARRWRDTHAAVGGSLAEVAAVLFDANWDQRHPRRRTRPGANGQTELLTNIGPGDRHRVRQLYSRAFGAARSRIEVTTPYFVPDPSILRPLRKAARRGVDVRLLVPLRSDVMVARWAGQSYYDLLIRSGVHVHEYQPRMLHAKTVVIDGRWAALGTANLDYRSFRLNTELVLMTRRSDLCEQLTQQFAIDLAESEEVRAETWAKRPVPQRWLERLAYAAREWL